MQIMKRKRHTLSLSRGRHSQGRNPSWHLPSPSLLPPFQLKPPSGFSAPGGFELIPSSWRTSLSSGDKRQKIIGFVENFCPNLVDPWDELSHLEDVFDEAGEDGEEVVEDGLVQTWTEDYVRLQQLHLCKEERLRRLLLFRLEMKKYVEADGGQSLAPGQEDTPEKRQLRAVNTWRQCRRCT